MKYLCKVTETGNQKRISLPKEFLRHNQWENVEYVVINDSDKRNIKIGKFNYGKDQQAESV